VAPKQREATRRGKFSGPRVTEALAKGRELVKEARGLK
jgi:hypothetical protein